MPTSNLDRAAAVGLLDEPVRRRLYEFVAAQHGPVSREQAAAQAGISRPLAAYHLDKLVDHGLLAASFARPHGRTGPGAGRTAKFYVRAPEELTVSLPSRDYQLAADLLADAVEDDPQGTVRDHLLEGARAAGERAAAAAGPPDAGADPAALMCVLKQRGYEPYVAPDGVIRLRNCPFHSLVERHRGLVCSMNLALLEGVVAGLGDACHRPSLDPTQAHCCVAITRTA
jgi:predicted ArsR family transcriptional regulator